MRFIHTKQSEIMVSINVYIHAGAAQTIMNADINRVGSYTAGYPDPSRLKAILLHRLMNTRRRWRVVISERQFIFLVDWLSTARSFPITCSSDNLTCSEYLPFNNQFTCYLSNYTVKPSLCLSCFLSLNICHSVSSHCLRFFTLLHI